MVSASDRVTIQGKPIDRLTLERYKSFNQLVKAPAFGNEKSDITVVQAIGGASASAGTHKAPGGSLDYTAFNQKNRIKADRLFGGAGWFRPTIKGVWIEHCHTVTAGVGYAPPLARGQVTAMYAGRNGLANNGKDTGPRLKVWPLFVAPWTDRGKRGTYYAKKGVTMRTEGTDKAAGAGSLPKGGKFTVIGVVNAGGVLWAINVNGKHVKKSDLTLTKPKATTKPKPTTPALPTQKKATTRVGTLNFPDKTKITVATEAARIKRAVAQIKQADLDIIGLQEGVGSKADGPDKDKQRDPSDLAARLVSALGEDWDLIEPTTAHNENYFLRRTGSTDYKQHPDAIIRGAYNGKALPGRHVTLVDFTTDTGKATYGNTQLVSNNRPGAVVQAVLAAAAIRKVAEKDPYVLLGDFNTTPSSLVGLASAGLRDSRIAAIEAGNRNAVTYTNQSKTKPSVNPEWLIDGIWVSRTITVNGYTVVLDLDSKGNFVLPRVSDHALTVVSLS